MTNSWRPSVHEDNNANWIWYCPEEGCDHRERGLAEHPLDDGVCKIHRRRKLIRRKPRGQGR